MPLYRGPGGAGDATNDATVTQVQEYATQAATSATNAANSATAASTSASSASTQASNATTSASNAAGQASTAASSASAAATSATNAQTSANNASSSANAAALSAAAASDSADDAASSASDAASSASSASTSASNASASATVASDAVDDALAIYGSAQDLEDAVTAAETAASNASGSAVSASEYAQDAADSASTALSNATAAQSSSNNAANAASAASVSATNAATSATSAASSAASALAIYGSTEAVNAAVANSQANRDAAAASATAASNSASASATSATASATSATAAATSAAQASAVALGNEPVRHSVRPSLLLDFANTKTLDPRITFTRASTGTFYDGKTVAKAEENLLIRSAEFDNAIWVKGSATVTANSTAAPDGTTTADTFTSSAGAAGHEVYQAGLSIPVNTPFTISVFIKAGTHNFFSISANGANSAAWFVATVDLSTGTITKTGAGVNGTHTASSITSVGNGWFRVVVTGSTSQPFSFVTIKSNSTNNPTYAGYAAESWTALGTETCFLWGAQLEQRSSVTAYTATTTAPITNYIPALQTAASGVARFDHNPVTGESLGLEIEEQRTNLFTYSDDFANAAWFKNNCSVQANATISPDGTLTADKFVEDSGSAAKYVAITSGWATIGTTYAISVHMKAAERQWAYIGPANEGNKRAWFNLSTGAVGTINSGVVSASMQSVGNGWYRCTVVFTAGATNPFPSFSATDANGTVSYQGNGTSGIYIWGAQLEAGSFATSYIPTVASQVTRSADSASMTGTNFSSWYRADEGTLYAETRALSDSVADVSNGLAISTTAASGSTMSLVMDTRPAQNASFYVFNSGANTGSVSVVSTMLGAPRKMAGAYAVNNVIMASGGTLSAADTSTAIPIGTQLSIGRYALNESLFDNGYVSKIAYYPKRLTNAELQGLTTV